MPVDQTNLYSGYQQASRYSPVPRSTLRKAIRPYGIRLKSLKGKTDQGLRQMAIQAVLDKRFDSQRPTGLKPRRPRRRATQMPTGKRTQIS